MLEITPQPHIIQPIALHCPEGLYLSKYKLLLSIPIRELSPPFIRKCFYRDTLSALTHPHEMKIVHADVRINNALWEEGGRVLLCDFA